MKKYFILNYFINEGKNNFQIELFSQWHFVCFNRVYTVTAGEEL